MSKIISMPPEMARSEPDTVNQYEVKRAVSANYREESYTLKTNDTLGVIMQMESFVLHAWDLNRSELEFE